MSNRSKQWIVTFLAWLFIASSLWPIVDGLKWPPHRMQPDRETYILRAIVDGREYTSWGLTYVGKRGYWLRVTEIAGVLAAAGLSLLRQATLRRLGLLALVGWSALWFGNAVRMAIVAPIPVFQLAAVLTLVFLIATMARARLAWTRAGNGNPARRNS